ncbi:DUF1697 domain-containing protein [Microbacterium sp. X-17]|uniref:DUF1697 domain-containing protein n=1 Tax=Microbacterium sp. X-17 TaxID=3144404 RepID=UPI0031F4DF96
MTEWVALLRGVNVNGITIRSVDLAALLRDLGLSEVKTVLASGNATFRSDDELSARSDLKDRIEKGLRDRFGYDAWILLVAHHELAAAIDAFPFDDADADRQPYVVFCVDEHTRAELADAAASLDASVDPVASGAGVVYWNPPKGQSTDTPFAKIAARTTYKARTTTRNLRTLRKILG